MPFVIISADGEPLKAHNGARLEFVSREEIEPLLMPGERVERIAVFSGEGMIGGADLPGRC